MPDKLRFARVLSAFVAEKKKGRGAQAWLVEKGGASKSQAKYWMEGSAVPKDRAFHGLMRRLRSNGALSEEWAARLLEAWRESREADWTVRLETPDPAPAPVLPPPPPLLDLWPRLDDPKRAAVVRVAELLAGASGGNWIDEQVDAFAAVARRHPLPDRSAGGAS